MGLFKKGSGSSQPIANKVPYTSKEPPLDNGNFNVGQKIMQQYPFGVGNNPQTVSLDDKLFNNNSWDDKFSPNLFGTWSDIYDTFIGSFKLKSAPPEIMRHEQMMKHILFINARLALFRVDDNKWTIGTYNIYTTDEYGRILTGTFTRWDYATGGFNEKNSIFTKEINETNNNNIVTFQFGNYNIPLFLKIGYLINFRNELYKYKNVNLRMSILHKIVGLQAGGKKIMEPFLQKLFNLNNKYFPSPIQILDLSADEINGDLSFNFKDLSNQIDFKVEYKGNEISLDIETMTKEIFRVAGFRTDISQPQTNYSERKTTSQVEMSNDYFGARENEMMTYFKQFEYDFKEKFPHLYMKWEMIGNEVKENDNDKDGVDDVQNI